MPVGHDGVCVCDSRDRRPAPPASAPVWSICFTYTRSYRATISLSIRLHPWPGRNKNIQENITEKNKSEPQHVTVLRGRGRGERKGGATNSIERFSSRVVRVVGADLDVAPLAFRSKTVEPQAVTTSRELSPAAVGHQVEVGRVVADIVAGDVCCAAMMRRAVDSIQMSSSMGRRGSLAPSLLFPAAVGVLAISGCGELADVAG
mmetsp:Transcript_36985/g.114214  ORF Transcript_36985/g.114214 Transcript_36985/m.114214 type:complete len:204 (+) Transcript_36985:153-764(+)